MLKIKLNSDGNPDSPHKPSVYMAYWNAIKESETPVNARKRRRRDSNGKRFSRDVKIRTRRDRGRTVISEAKQHVKNAMEENKSYARFQQKGTGRVIVANYDIQVS